MNVDVYAFGSALIDIQVHVKDSLLSEIGVEKGNMYLTERERQEEIVTTLLGETSLELDQVRERLHTAAGGSAANTVFGVAHLGGQGGLCGKVAHDRFGTLYTELMKESKVVFSGRKSDGMTGTCIVLISDDAQRTMLTCLGVSSEITYDDIDEELLKSSKYVYIEGYLFDSEVATLTLMAAVETAKKNNVRIALTASDAFCIERHKDIFLKLIHNDVDLLFANAKEAQALTGTTDTREAVQALAGMCTNIAVTDGAKGSILSFNKELLRVEPFMVTALDTTGAGDSYAAGLLFGLANGYSVEASGKIASFYASRVVANIGPRYGGDIGTEIKSLRLEG